MNENVVAQSSANESHGMAKLCLFSEVIFRLVIVGLRFMTSGDTLVPLVLPETFFHFLANLVAPFGHSDDSRLCRGVECWFKRRPLATSTRGKKST